MTATEQKAQMLDILRERLPEWRDAAQAEADESKDVTLENPYMARFEYIPRGKAIAYDIILAVIGDTYADIAKESSHA